MTPPRRTLQQASLVVALMLGGHSIANTLAQPDQAFLEQAAQNGQAELSAGRLALTKARNPQVQAFAQRMIEDHTRMSEELVALATARNYKPPTEPSMLQKGKEMVIGGMADETFDRRYVHQMGVEAHMDTIRLYEKAANDARDPEVKAFAAKHLPHLREHLEVARDLKTKVEPTTPPPRR
jgi:putative membrane protein